MIENSIYQVHAYSVPFLEPHHLPGCNLANRSWPGALSQVLMLNSLHCYCQYHLKHSAGCYTLQAGNNIIYKDSFGTLRQSNVPYPSAFNITVNSSSWVQVSYRL